jgi:hypothetical protein
MPRAVGQAGQDQQGRIGKPAKTVELLVHPHIPLLRTD